MADHMLRFGDYTLPPTLHLVSAALPGRIGTAEVPRRGGVVAQARVPGPRTVAIEGTIWSSDLRLALETIAARLADRQQLWLYDDRYLWAQLANLTSDWQPGQVERHCQCALEFLCDDPYFYAADEESSTWTAPGDGDDTTLSILGTAPCRPTFAITAGATGSWGLELAVGDISFTLTGDAESGDVITVDCAAESCTKDLSGEAVDSMELFDGSFPPFEPGSNLIGLSNSGIAVAQIAISWRGRWT